MPNQISRVAADDALTAVYRLAVDEGCEVIAARLAERLGVTPPSMAAMLSRLRRDRLIWLDRRKRISLTDAGLARAETMVRRHRLAERLLVDVLGLEWWRAYDEAHLLEHALSAVTEPLVARLVGDPSASPFGYPIPGGVPIPDTPELRLSDVAPGDRAVIRRVFEEDVDLLRFLDRHSLRPGVEVTVAAVAPALIGTIAVQGDGCEATLGLPAAQRIWVDRLVERAPEAG